MPKVTGPLFSVTARGSLGKMITFRQVQNSSLVSIHSAPTGAASAVQTAYRNRVGEMAGSWSSQTQPVKDLWIARGVFFSLSGYQLWWREWIAQGSTPNNPPALP